MEKSETWYPKPARFARSFNKIRCNLPDFVTVTISGLTLAGYCGLTRHVHLKPINPLLFNQLCHH